MNYQEILENAPEIAEFCKQKRLLDGPYQGNSSQVLVIHDSNEALLTCGTDRGDGYEFWSELCEREYAKLEFSSPHWLPGKIDQFLVGPLRQRTNDENLTLKIPIIWDAVQQDIWFCMASKSASKPSPLFAMIEDAYLLAGWPCGWKGNFPEGQLVVFSTT